MIWKALLSIVLGAFLAVSYFLWVSRRRRGRILVSREVECPRCKQYLTSCGVKAVELVCPHCACMYWAPGDAEVEEWYKAQQVRHGWKVGVKNVCLVLLVIANVWSWLFL